MRRAAIYPTGEIGRWSTFGRDSRGDTVQQSVQHSVREAGWLAARLRDLWHHGQRMTDMSAVDGITRDAHLCELHNERGSVEQRDCPVL